ncbi:hypothetical protein [Caulobacter segnis]
MLEKENTGPPPHSAWEAFWGWPFDPHHTYSVAGWGFWLAVFGASLSIGGFLITWLQLRQARNVAEATREEAERISKSLYRIDITQEITKSISSISSSRRNFSNRLWGECLENCEDAIKSLSIIYTKIDDNRIEDKKIVEKASQYFRKLCERIDRNEMNEIDQENFAKTKASLRQHETSIARLVPKIQKEAING